MEDGHDKLIGKNRGPLGGKGRIPPPPQTEEIVVENGVIFQD